jgi:hypothetical protein
VDADRGQGQFARRQKLAHLWLVALHVNDRGLTTDAVPITVVS